MKTVEITIGPYDPLSHEFGPGWPLTPVPLEAKKEIERRLIELGADPKGRFQGEYIRCERKSVFWSTTPEEKNEN